MRPGWNARGERGWRQLARWLLLGASLLGTHVAMGGTTGALELGLFAGCILINEARIRTRLDRSGPLMTLFWVFLFVAIPSVYLVYRASSIDPATDPLSISSGLRVPVEPIIISLALPFQVFAAYVPGIPRAQHLVLAFVLVEAILGARSQAWTPNWVMILALLFLVGLCLVVGHVASVTVAVRARGSGEVRRRVSAGNLLRFGTLGLLARAILVATLCGAILFVLAPRKAPRQSPQRETAVIQADRPPRESHRWTPPTDERTSPTDLDSPNSVAHLSNGVSLGDFGRILRDHTPVADVHFSPLEGPNTDAINVKRPLLKATSLSRFDGSTWAAPGRTRVGPNTGWEPYESGGMIEDDGADSGESLASAWLYQLRLLVLSEAAPLQLFLPARPLGIRSVWSEHVGSMGPRIEYHAGHDEYRVWGWYDGSRITGYEAIIRSPVLDVPRLESPTARARVHPDLTALPTAFRAILELEWTDLATFRSYTRNPLELARRVDSWFRQPGRFRYSLDYRPVGDDAILKFICLPKERQGHCEYFASAMAVVMRYFGVPARVCVGYAPSNQIPDAAPHSYRVLKSDAHAWVEVFSPTHGWVSFDPTPPADLAAAPPTLFDPQPTTSLDAEADVHPFDPITEFSSERRSQILEAIGGAMTWFGGLCTTVIELPWKLLPPAFRPPSGIASWLLTVGIIAIGLALALPSVRKRLRRRALVDAGMGSHKGRTRKGNVQDAELTAERARGMWRDLLTILADHGYVRARHQTPTEFAEAVARAGGEKFAPVTIAAEAYGFLRYGDPGSSPPSPDHSNPRDVEADFHRALAALSTLPKSNP